MPGNFAPVPEWVLEHVWPAPNYVDPVRRTWMPAFAFVFPAVSTILIGGRYWLRYTGQSGAWGIDDVFIGIGWLVSIGFSATGTTSTERYDVDRHTWDVIPTHYEGAALCGWIAQVLFLVSTCATKTSVLLFYRRMVAGTYSRTWLYTIWAALAFNAAYFISILFVYCFLCQPLSSYWESYNFDYDKPYTCINGNVLNPFIGVLSVFTDIYTVILPCAMLSKVELDVPRRQKIGLNIIFALGLVVGGFGIARTYYLWEINNNYDTSWTGFNLLVWSMLECHFAVIFACAPALRAFVRRYLGESLSRTFGSSKNRSQNKSSDRRNTPDWASKDRARPPSLTAEGPHRSLDKDATQRHVTRRVSKDSLDERGNFYFDESKSPTPSTRGQDSRPIRSADEYEAYAMAQLSRHAFNRTAPIGDGPDSDWNDPRRRYDSENAV